MQRYISPDLKVIETGKDIIATSLKSVVDNAEFTLGSGSVENGRAAGRGWDECYEGY